jgi:hypothetical protein
LRSIGTPVSLSLKRVREGGEYHMKNTVLQGSLKILRSAAEAVSKQYYFLVYLVNLAIAKENSPEGYLLFDSGTLRKVL